jgi:hypothetical protein
MMALFITAGIWLEVSICRSMPLAVNVPTSVLPLLKYTVEDCCTAAKDTSVGIWVFA